jgi:hypothetical protein
VVLISGCNDIYSAIDFKYPKDKYGLWSECVMRESLRYRVSNPTLEKAINKKCEREMLIKEIRKHRKEQKELEKREEETIKMVDEYLNENK